jgi:hypothetical protein
MYVSIYNSIAFIYSNMTDSPTYIVARGDLVIRSFDEIIAQLLGNQDVEHGSVFGGTYHTLFGMLQWAVNSLFDSYNSSWNSSFCWGDTRFFLRLPYY